MERFSQLWSQDNLIKATFKNQIMESVCDLDNNQLPSLRGLANRFNKALPII